MLSMRTLIDIRDVFTVSQHLKTNLINEMYDQCIYQRRSDGACITKVPLPPVRSQAGAGYLATPGMGIPVFSGMQKATCASITNYKLTLQYKFDETQPLLTPMMIARSLEQDFPNDLTMLISQNRSKNSMLVETSDENTFRSVSKITEINGYPVKIEALIQDISTKGIFYCEEDLNLTESEEKQLRDQGVTMLYRIKHTDMYAVTFDGKFLPDTLMISRLAFEISLYVPKPRRCFRCQRYGHTESHCRHPRVCPKCGNVGHTFEACNNDPSCYHCFGRHPTSSHDCPRYILEQLVLDYKVTKGIDFKQARSYIYKSYPDIVNKIPRLKCSVSPLSMNKSDNEISLIENIVENLNKTIEAQQSQIDILIGELREYKSLLNSKSFANETSQMTQTNFHSHIEIPPLSYELKDTDMNSFALDDDLSHIKDIYSENEIPQILALQNPSEVESSDNMSTQSSVYLESSPLPNDVVVFADYLQQLPVSSLNSSLTIPDDVSSGISDLVDKSDFSNKNQSIYDDINLSDDHIVELMSQNSNENFDLKSLASMTTHEETSISSDFIEVIYDRRGRLVKPPTQAESFENEESRECKALSYEMTPCEEPHNHLQLDESSPQSISEVMEIIKLHTNQLASVMSASLIKITEEKIKAIREQ